MGEFRIHFTNIEGGDIEGNVDDTSSGGGGGELEGAENPVILETVESDDDKTKAIKGRRLIESFNSVEYTDSYKPNVDTFSDGDDSTFTTNVEINFAPSTTEYPFKGTLVLDDNSEPFQPRPNVVVLKSGEGFGTIRDLELKESDGDVPVDHYRIIDYIYLCLINLIQNTGLKVAMNLFEVDTDPVTSHAFIDTHLDARTFETDVNKREDRFTVLNKILEAFGCFITYNNGYWIIIRWDEYDKINDGTTFLRFANFIDNGDFYEFVDYTTEDVDKIIAHYQDVLYEGFFMSMDSAIKRFQRRAKSVEHEYKYEQPKEVPCNSAFLRGTVDDDVLPLKTYDPECWTLRSGFPGSYGTPNSEMKIAVHYDANDVEDDRYIYITAETSHANKTYVESEGIDIHKKDKCEIEINWRLEANADFGNQYHLMQIYLKGDDGSHWLLGNTTISDPTTPLKWWNTSGFTVNTLAGVQDIDFTLIEETEWQNQSIEDVPEIPVDGKLYIWLNQINQTNISEDNQTINYSDLRFTYIPLVGGTYRRVNGHSHKVTGDNDSRKEIVHEMFIGDSPKKLFKGALKKFDGTNYVLTENWDYYNETGYLGVTGAPLGKHIVFQWWQQFRKTRTVIETDVQGLRSTHLDGTPGLQHRWKIIHGGQENKKFMLTSFRGMDFYKCGWQGVFVEMSSEDGDRNYDDDYLFSYIYS